LLDVGYEDKKREFLKFLEQIPVIFLVPNVACTVSLKGYSHEILMVFL
jgi:hypothetical protein